MKQSEWAERTEPVQPQPDTQPEAQPQTDGQQEPEHKTAALQAENKRLQTQIFAYERAMLALQNENAALEQQCAQLKQKLEASRAEQKRLLASAQRRAAQSVPLPEQEAEPLPAQADPDILSAELIEKLNGMLPQQDEREQMETEEE